MNCTGNRKPTERVVNVDVVVKEKSQQIKKDISGCAFILSNFCERDKLLKRSADNLQQEDYHILVVMIMSGRITLDRKNAKHYPSRKS